MKLWKCIFNETTLIGTGWEREPKDGEVAIEVDATLCGWFNWHPSRYRLENGSIVERAEWVAEEAAREAAQGAAIAAMQTRIAEIEAAQTSADLKQYTVKQGTDWITNKLTNAPNTYSGIKQAVGEILIKMLPYILPKD